MKRNKLIVSIGLLLIGVFALYGFASAEMTCVTTWGSYGPDQGEFDYPRGIAVDPVSGQVYVADTNNNRVQIFDSVGNPVYPNELGGSFNLPRDIAIDPGSGNVYVTDYTDKSIQKFNSEGGYLGKWDVSPYCPYGITVDPVSGYVFVANNCTTSSIMIFDVNGEPQSLTDSDLSSGPYTDARDIASDSDGDFYVVDGGGTGFIYMFDSSGDYRATWNVGTGNDPNYIAVDSQGYVYVAYTGSSCVKKFSVDKDASPQPSLTLEQTLSDCNGTLSGPTGVALSLEGNLYVADSGNNRIVKFAPSCRAALESLSETVIALNLHHGITNSLDAKLQNALDALDAENAGQRQDAINKVEAFINAVEAQSGDKIPETDADLLIATANSIIQCLQQ